MKKKIAVIGLKGLPAFGGAAAVGENIIEKLKNDFEFTVLSVSSHTVLKRGYVNGVHQLVFGNCGKGSLNTMLYYLKSLLHCLINKYDLIHLHHAGSGFITPFLRMRSKVIVTFHGVYSYSDPKFSNSQNSFFRLCEKLNVRYANEVISVSKPDQEFIINKYGKKIKYIPNGIAITNLDKAEERAEKEKEYILFAAGRIFQTKGLHILLKAAKKINLKTEIIIAGDMDQVEDYKNEISELKKNLNVNFIGLIKDKNKLSELINDALFFVFPSLNEAMSMMLLEVVAEKTPVIASDIPSNKAVFSNNEVLFFESTNANDLADKLSYSLMNKEELKSQAKRAYEKLINHYTWDTISLLYKEIYNEQINNKSLN
jgi:glycosyltransferase involved in cell wall biosynthesis